MTQKKNMNSKQDINPLLFKTKAINPYKNAKQLILNRLKWDLTPASWVSRKRLGHWENKFSGKKAVILCNGPSLLESDFSLLNNVFTFGLNKINLLFSKTDFISSCIVAVNPYVIEQNKEFYNNTNIPLFLDCIALKKGIHLRKNIAYLHSSIIREFARDCSISVYQGHTVTFVAIQLAFHMGFSEVALIGCDHNFTTKGHANMLITSTEDDPNHFDPNYFGKGMQWQLPDLFESEVAYTMAKNMYEAYDRKLINATTGGKLSILDRMTLNDFLDL